MAQNGTPSLAAAVALKTPMFVHGFRSEVWHIMLVFFAV